MGSSPVFGRVRVAHLLRFMCCGFFWGFLCVFLRPVSCVPNVACDCPFLIAPSGFSNVYLVK